MNTLNELLEKLGDAPAPAQNESLETYQKSISDLEELNETQIH